MATPISGDYLLLKNPKECPRCRTHSVSKLGHICCQCGVKLWPSMSFDFQAYERDTGDRDYYAFHPQFGWMHHDHLKNPQPLHRAPKINMPDSGYNRHMTPDDVSSGRANAAFKRCAN